MSKKKVEVFQIRIKTVDGSELNFEDLLLNDEFASVRIKSGPKYTQFVFIEEKGDLILGLVQSTKMVATPPKNNILTNELSALGLTEPEGLAYGNVFLYSKSTKFFLYEVTKDGLYMGQFSDHIYKLYSIYNEEKDERIVAFDIRFDVVMNIDAMKKILGMGSQKAIHMQFAAPGEIVKKVKNNQKSLKEIAKPGEEFGAELIDVVYKITSRKDKSLHTGKINQMLSWIEENYDLMKDNVKKFAIRGYEEDEENITEVDLIKDKMLESISYNEDKNMRDLKPTFRKQEITEAYQRIKNDLDNYLLI
ncbi:DUF6731 family protein [Mucilaginibacter phyllosphaerae]|uniref:Uncharacterized protein n=1 Tax=Mucilaginibacter phyllosphaerae TaxID=1812349 RepID=A0A4Y8A5J9_9SPHI|nr:DUF6731 family protein [Mucilaginibacter phyllosphaerae]MBB3969533.1 hypothetical protein [Mucilaginibacter phyllosphaerae]TEW63630.1 hypothetical protein E2R65_19380 [Mucilaginibacter phyllosphaerae]GGH23823.1 hypothetical protein GCM10007352_37930 [Mucilaginibacter phyllosphaerae]